MMRARQHCHEGSQRFRCAENATDGKWKEALRGKPGAIISATIEILREEKLI
jgi:hypothetical protein